MTSSDNAMQDALRDLYQEVILDHGRHPRNHRHPPAANRQARGYNPLCGDQVTIYLQTDAGGRILDVAFERSEEHTSELQSLMRTSYAVFCLKKKKKNELTMKHD